MIMLDCRTIYYYNDVLILKRTANKLHNKTRRKRLMENFQYKNPTKLIFGKDQVGALKEELPQYGRNVLLVYGGGSIKRNGL